MSVLFMSCARVMPAVCWACDIQKLCDMTVYVHSVGSFVQSIVLSILDFERSDLLSGTPFGIACSREHGDAGSIQAIAASYATSVMKLQIYICSFDFNLQLRKKSFGKELCSQSVVSSLSWRHQGIVLPGILLCSASFLSMHICSKRSEIRFSSMIHQHDRRDALAATDMIVQIAKTVCDVRPTADTLIPWSVLSLQSGRIDA